MSKTPEQLAEEYCEDHDECEFARDAFLAGYQAAKDEYKVAIDTYNDVAKQMLEEAVRIMSPQDQAADADKVMNSSNNSNGWISVKEQLPPPETEVLWWNKTAHQAGVSSWQYKSYCNDTMIYWGDAGNLSIKNFTHWMPLPKPPEE
jgi:hypothetical protein